MSDDTCLNCSNKVPHDSVFCSEKCHNEWDVKQYEKDQKKLKSWRKRRKILSYIAIGLTLLLSVLIVGFFYPQYELGILKHDEHYPRDVQIEDCSVTYNINKGNIIFPTNITCNSHPNQTKVDRLITEINNISDILNKELMTKHPNLIQKLPTNET